MFYFGDRFPKTAEAINAKIGTFRLDYEYEIEYEYDFRISNQ